MSQIDRTRLAALPPRIRVIILQGQLALQAQARRKARFFEILLRCEARQAARVIPAA